MLRKDKMMKGCLMEVVAAAKAALQTDSRNK
jgi:hypothetical protein